jgi:hypothetical protein
MVLGAALVVGVAGCGFLGEPAPNVASPNHHAEHELEFDYPGNWTLEGEVEDAEGFELYTVEIESSGNALAMVQQFKPSLPLDVEQLMADVTEGLRAGAKEELGGMFDYVDGGLTDVERTTLGELRKGKEKRYALSGLGEKAEHTMHMYPVELEDRSLILYMQIPDEDRAKAQPGFDLIFDTLVLR